MTDLRSDAAPERGIDPTGHGFDHPVPAHDAFRVMARTINAAWHMVTRYAYASARERVERESRRSAVDAIAEVIHRIAYPGYRR